MTFFPFGARILVKWPFSMIDRVSLKKYRCFISNRTEVFCLIFKLSSVLDKAYLNLHFEITIVEIR